MASAASQVTSPCIRNQGLGEVLPPTLFFAIGFNLIVLTTQLVLADYLVHFANFILVTLSALIVGKAVVVANALPFFRRFDTAPLIQPVLFKTVIYWAVVLVVRFLERLGIYWFTGGTLSGIPEYVANNFSVESLCCYPDLGLRSVSDLHPRRGAEFAVWQRRAGENTFLPGAPQN